MKKMINIFKPKPSLKTYHLPQIERADLSTSSHRLQDIWDEKMDGVIIKDVFTHEQCIKIIQAFDTIDQAKLYESLPGVFTYPHAFSKIAHGSEQDLADVKHYIDEYSSFWKQFMSSSGIDCQGTIKKVLEDFDAYRTAATPNEMGLDHFPPFSIRKMVPPTGHLPIHCGNTFPQEHTRFFANLSNQTQLMNQLSFFIMLQPPEKGGALNVYNITSDQVIKKLPDEITLLGKENKRFDTSDPDKVPQTKIALKQGEMLIFSGGKYWHKVDHILGKASRYTLGGFITASIDGKTVHYWS